MTALSDMQDRTKRKRMGQKARGKNRKVKVRRQRAENSQSIMTVHFSKIMNGANPTLTPFLAMVHFFTPYAGVAQLARARACQARGRRFETGHPLSYSLWFSGGFFVFGKHWKSHAIELFSH